MGKDDLISRQAAIDALCKVCSLTSNYEKCEGYKPNSQWCDEVTVLRGLPSIQPRKGKWICQADDDIWNCSECDYEIDGTGCIDPLEYLKTYKFCPNCGCRMREGEA